MNTERRALWAELFRLIVWTFAPIVVAAACLIASVCSVLRDDPAHVWLAYFSGFFVFIAMAEREYDRRKELDL